jgi:hypothetical protein
MSGSASDIRRQMPSGSEMPALMFSPNSYLNMHMPYMPMYGLSQSSYSIPQQYINPSNPHIPSQHISTPQHIHNPNMHTQQQHMHSQQHPMVMSYPDQSIYQDQSQVYIRYIHSISYKV